MKVKNKKKRAAQTIWSLKPFVCVVRSMCTVTGVSSAMCAVSGSMVVALESMTSVNRKKLRNETSGSVNGAGINIKTCGR